MEIRCKLFMGTLKKAALDWFSGLPDRSITNFDVFNRLFMAQFTANKKKPLITSDLFDLKQQHEESLKDFLQRFNEVALRITSLDERMAVIAFQKGLRSGTFDIALETTNCQTMSEVRAFALSHIKTEEGQINKRAAESREAGGSNKEDNKHLRVRLDWNKRRDHYNAKEGNRRQILHDVNNTSPFEFPAVTDHQLGPFKTDWCEFHRTHGHTAENCFILGRQIERLIKEGHLKKFVARKHDERPSNRQRRHEGEDTKGGRHKGRSPPRDLLEKISETHQQAIHGDFNTIAGGFAGGGPTSVTRKRYSRSVLSVSEWARPTLPAIIFLNADFEGVSPHEDNPIVISAIIMGYNVKRMLVDQGSSVDIMFWEAFIGMKISTDRLMPYAGTLVGFAGDQVTAKGYADMETTFGQGDHMKTITVRYLVVNAQSSYSILVGRPTLNKLGAVVSTPHLKLKYLLPSGKVGVLCVEVARKCYEDSLRVRRHLYVTQVDRGIQSIELDSRMIHFDSRPAPVEDVKEVSLAEGKTVKIGVSLAKGDEEGLVTVLKSNISAFAWSASDMPGIDPDFLCHHLMVDPKAKPMIQKR
ncbi:uncharacterized protein LOC109792422 [Cajanus cajan]|uniref:uncharacterized protein LOC109792422 n=1 Tax=Cajanus cajan TaxID=3821 RepID=UPI00098DBD47|nr:uncharacterized protein LOC109792422 [Cajanus cajan]